MRSELRKTSHKIFVLDVEGNQRGFRITPNIFEILTPIAISSVVFRPQAQTPNVHLYHLVEGTKQQKKSFCKHHQNVSQIDWQPIRGGTHDFLLPAQTETYSSFHSITELFPLQKPGCQFGRNTLRNLPLFPHRLATFVKVKKTVLFKESSNRKIIQRIGHSQNPNQYDIPLQNEKYHH